MSFRCYDSPPSHSWAFVNGFACQSLQELVRVRADWKWSVRYYRKYSNACVSLCKRENRREGVNWCWHLMYLSESPSCSFKRSSVRYCVVLTGRQSTWFLKWHNNIFSNFLINCLISPWSQLRSFPSGISLFSHTEGRWTPNPWLSLHKTGLCSNTWGWGDSRSVLPGGKWRNIVLLR